jgi:chromosomal replication initiator protein
MSPQIAVGIERAALMQYVHKKQPAHIRDNLAFENIIKVVTLHTNITKEQMQSSSRKRDVVTARHIAMLIIKNCTSISLVEIGKRFGGRDHSTVIYSIQSSKDLFKYNIYFRDLMNKITRESIVIDLLNGV